MHHLKKHLLGITSIRFTHPSLQHAVILFALVYCSISLATPPLFEDTFSPIINRAQQLALKHRAHPNTPIPIIAIAGCTAVGKTHFTKELIQHLRNINIRVDLFPMDDYLEPAHVPHATIHPHFDHVALYQALERIRNNEKHIEKTTWDHSGAQSVKQPCTACFWNVDLIVFEGIYTLCDSSSYDLLKYSSLRIFITSSDENIAEWKWRREILKQSKARSKKKLDHDIAWDLDNYHRYILPMIKHADFVIEKDAQHSYALL